MTMNPGFVRGKEERNNESFFKILQSVNVCSENMRALPHDFVRSFSDKELSCKIKIKTQWGHSWEVGISKNPRFYFMEVSGWKNFVRDNALGNNEFITFNHKGKMHFTVNIFKQNGKEMMQPLRQSRAFLSSSSRIKTEQREDDKKEEVVVSSELGNRCPTRATESNGGTNKRKLNLGKKNAVESQNSKKAKKVVRAQGDSAGASSSSVAEFIIFIKKSSLKSVTIPKSFAKIHMPKKNAMFKIHHPNGEWSWNVKYLPRVAIQAVVSAGWSYLVKEYPIRVGDTCKLTLIKPDEILLVVSKP